MRKQRIAAAALLIVSVLSMAHPAQALWGEAKTKTQDGDADMGLPEYKGLKHAVGVKDFDNDAGWSGQWQLGQNLSAMLESALYDTGRFVLVEREQLTDVIQEQDLAASGRTAGAKKVAKTGLLRSAKYLATGAITEVDAAQSGGDAGVRIKGFRVGLGKQEAQVTIIAKLIDTTTGEIVSKKRIVGKPSGSKLNFGYSGADLGVDLGGFKKTPLGQAAQDCIAQAAKFFAETMEEFPFEGSVVKVSDRGQVIINRGSEFGVEVGQRLVMKTEGETLIDPDTGEILDQEEGEVIGTLSVAKVSEKVSYCDVIDGEKDPERGTVVAAR
jgi:curli biogenesis system outer membrane secretion channel CsgG